MSKSKNANKPGQSDEPPKRAPKTVNARDEFFLKRAGKTLLADPVAIVWLIASAAAVIASYYTEGTAPELRTLIMFVAALALPLRCS